MFSYCFISPTNIMFLFLLITRWCFQIFLISFCCCVNSNLLLVGLIKENLILSHLMFGIIATLNYITLSLGLQIKFFLTRQVEASRVKSHPFSISKTISKIKQHFGHFSACFPIPPPMTVFSFIKMHCALDPCQLTPDIILPFHLYLLL